MKNFPIKDSETGKEYWISRALAVCGIILAYNDNGDPYLFLQKRGPGCPDYQGCWSHTCGYLDYDETLQEALGREVYEEIGLGLIKVGAKITTIGWNDLPGADPRQNVTFRYVIQVSLNDLKEAVSLDVDSSRGGEDKEVSDYLIIPVSELDIDKLEFAFNHRELTEQILCDSRFIPSKEDKDFGATMTLDKYYKSNLLVENKFYELYIKKDKAGIITITCPDLGFVVTPASLPSKIREQVKSRMVEDK